MEKKELLYEGKAKQVYATEDPNIIIMHYKNDATAGNGAKHALFDQKGELNNKITTIIYNRLIKAGIPTHYIKTLNETDQLCKKVKIFPLEVIVRDYIAGSMAKRLGIVEGTKPSNVIFEICYKNDALGDPLINDHHAVAIGAATYDELNTIYSLTAKVNEELTKLFNEIGVKLIDFKVEFGRTADGEIVLADEISPDCCRLWDAKTNDHLDKDRFRRDLGDVMGAYKEILKRLNTLKD
jgi:phosphoribosylaminoimidazole-succinocarboxamide synthase